MTANAWRPGVAFSTMIAASLLPTLARADDRPVLQTAPVEVIGVTPVQGTGIDKDKVPVNVQTFSAKEVGAGSALGINDSLSRRMGSVSLADYQGNEFQPSLSFRGFTASPVLGEPQGLAVYQNGMRANEAFGDVVNWDTIPSFAVDKLQVLPGSNPVFGLNALGGAISMQMKNGFNMKGSSVDLAGGLYGRAKSVAETGLQTGNVGFYTGVMALNDDGWRKYSPSRVVQSYSDLGWRGDSTEIGLGLTLAGSYLGNNGATPREILDSSRSSPFTTPDNQRDALAAVDLRVSHEINDQTSLQLSTYVRHLRSAVQNGNASQFQDCGDDNAGQLCSDGGTPLADRNGNAIPTPAGSIAQINNLLTQTDSGGASAQISHQRKVFGLDNSLIAGLSVDGGRTRYTASTEVANFDDQRVANGTGYILGGTNFTDLRATNAYGGLYATDTLSLTPKLDWTIAGRYNAAEVRLQDENGTALNGDHSFTRLNPSTGLTYKLTPGVTTFANYSEANRVPTAAELSCADPNQPCRVPNAFAGDPALKQVVSRGVEAGARGQVALGAKDRMNWSFAGFASNNQNDIIFVTSGTQATAGYFRNAGYTQRTGIEGQIDGRHGPIGWFASYALVHATFESAFDVANPSNPGADAGGNIHVLPGSVMPGIPRHILKAGASYDMTERWTLGGDMVATTGVFLRGDEANLQEKTAPYAVFNAETNYRLTDNATVYLRANNIFNTSYATAGVYSDGSQFGFPSADRFLTPGAPFNVWAGVRMSF
jgi:outer membrane receptor protein involved in Fe transport